MVGATTTRQRYSTVRIKTIEPIAVSLPMLKPVIMAGEEIRRADNVLVRIEADSGLVGWGEGFGYSCSAATARRPAWPYARCSKGAACWWWRCRRS